MPQVWFAFVFPFDLVAPSYLSRAMERGNWLSTGRPPRGSSLHHLCCLVAHLAGSSLSSLLFIKKGNYSVTFSALRPLQTSS